MTIIREPARGADPSELALRALGWILADSVRADRFLALTGLTPDELRAGLDDRGVLAAVLDFLANHEADLVMAADALDIAPAMLVSARETLA